MGQLRPLAQQKTKGLCWRTQKTPLQSWRGWSRSFFSPKQQGTSEWRRRPPVRTRGGAACGTSFSSFSPKLETNSKSSICSRETAMTPVKQRNLPGLRLGQEGNWEHSLPQRQQLLIQALSECCSLWRGKKKTKKKQVCTGIYVSPDDVERKSCVLSFPNPEGFWFKASRIYTLLLGFAFPVSTTCILYTVMLYKLRNMRLNSNAKVLDKAKKKVTVMVFIVLAVCLFCWTPFHLSTIVALTTDLTSTPLVIGISYFITSLSYANSCLNPFLYAFLDDSFRKAFKKMLECRQS
ncbi:B1 bradykinin receptor-like isoform X2 [Anguilla rostrata]|uniref:B1 bradykinin receptor-like isoform X2 n=1 Tax=Anguilla rostrata TaxID=7938 RepID=UPI0030CCB0C9